MSSVEDKGIAVKKVLLATWYENHNYGTALQAYSLKSIIQNPSIANLGTTGGMMRVCDLLPHRPIRRKMAGRKFSKVLSPHAYLEKMQQWNDKRILRREKECFARREDAFASFVENNFTFASDSYVQEEPDLSALASRYDLVVAGSDQIWNPEALDPTYLLEWAEGGKKCSYGSSLSVKSISAADEGIYRKALADFRAISIRDSACRSQLQRIVGKPVKTVVDPVILLGRDGLIKNAPRLGLRPFEFCYFLGNNRNHRKAALEVAGKMKLPIHAVINAGSDFAADRVLEQYADWDVDPWKFVSYINEADFVMTDSFHATVISVLCHTDFVVLEKDSGRPEQNNRILEFLDAVGLTERWETEGHDRAISAGQWEYADEAILSMRKDSYKYLMEALA